MSEVAFYQIDAFTDQRFKGNPAAVCPMDSFPHNDLLQAIAAENNLAETAYIVEQNGEKADYHLRWFTPTVEVNMCGHATLASAFVVFKYLKPQLERIRFKTLSGIITVERSGDKLLMDFPALSVEMIATPEGLGAAMGAEPEAVYEGQAGDRDLLLVYDSADTIKNLTPDIVALHRFAPFGFIATAKGQGEEDFVSRCFFPNHGIDEDPVTGSAHCVSGPYWANQLNKRGLFARQISTRSGDLWLNVKDNGRIEISGYAVEVIKGTLFIPD